MKTLSLLSLLVIVLIGSATIFSFAAVTAKTSEKSDIGTANIFSRSERLIISDNDYQLHINSSEPFKVTISIGSPGLIDSGESFTVWYKIGDGLTDFYMLTVIDNNKIQTYEFVCNEFALFSITPGDGLTIDYSLIITYSGEEPRIL